MTTTRKIINPVTDLKLTKNKVLNWLKKFSTFCFLDNNGYRSTVPTFECLAAAGIKTDISSGPGNALGSLQDFIRERSPSSWLFGHLSYELKEEIYALPETGKPDPVGFPALYFFEPEVLIRIRDGELMIEAEDPERVYLEIENGVIDSNIETRPPVISSRVSKDEYLAVIERLKQHIHRGDCYEINYCMEFFQEGSLIDPVLVYERLQDISPNPFSVFYRTEDKWLICASPERFLRKQGSKLTSQPIKGTASRSLDNEELDKKAKEDLFQSQKDRSENVMVVDLVRNDLSRVCNPGTVKVEELYGIYSYPQVHQMISTVSGELKEGSTFSDIIRSCFPMGSMTGAPKKRVLELIDQYEKSSRGIFSGAVGYMDPRGDFDFNVVIRSLMYNAGTGYLSFQAGSGITFYSDPGKEWEECLLKAEAIRRALKG